MTKYVGVDIAKSIHYAAMTNQHGEVLIEPFAFNNDKSGFDLFLKTVKSSMSENEELIVGFESTAHYAANFAHFLDSNSIICISFPALSILNIFCFLFHSSGGKTLYFATVKFAPVSTSA